MCVTREAVRDYNEYSQELLKGTVWAADCKSWYKNGKTEGKVTALYAGSVLHFRGMSRTHIKGSKIVVTDT